MAKIEVDGVTHVPEQTGERTAIVVCDRGFVLVGRISVSGSYVTITHCSNVRRWGTSRGLGEIASGGPTDSTILDPQPTTRVHELQVVQIIDCVESKWTL